MASLWQLWQATAHRVQDKTVLIDEDTCRTWTGGELMAEASRRSEQLPDGVRGRGIAFCLPNGAEWFNRFLAIQRCGAVAIPLDAAHTPEAQMRAAEALRAHFLWDHDACRKLHDGPAVHRRACLLKITSGSTGLPKALPCTAAHLVADGRQIRSTMGIRQTDLILGCIPLGHSYGLGHLVMPLLSHGATVVTANTFLPREILALMAQYRVTVFPTVPVVLRALAQLDNAVAPPGLRLIISAGGPLTPDVAQAFHRRYGIRIHNFYGSTETGGICYDRTGKNTLTGAAIGKPLDGVTVRIRRDGRVCVQSAAVAAPRHRIVLADLGRWNAAGDLQLMGRADIIANIGGRKVVPSEIESCLRELPGVTDAWVTVLRDARGSDYLAAVVETRRSQKVLERALRRRLPVWKLPKRYFLRDALPRTARGKIDGAYLRARLSTTLP